MNKSILSAYRIRLAFWERFNFDIEFITMLNRRGPRIDPWGTPEVTSTGSEIDPCKTTFQ